MRFTGTPRFIRNLKDIGAASTQSGLGLATMKVSAVLRLSFLTTIVNIASIFGSLEFSIRMVLGCIPMTVALFLILSCKPCEETA